MSTVGVDAAIAAAERAGMATWEADARYTQLVRAHSSSLMKLAVLLAGNPHDAEDAVQEALISVARAWSRVKPPTEYAYLKKAVVHAVADVQRRRRDMPAAELPERAADDLALLRHEEDREFVALVRELPAQQRAVIVLRYYADFDDRDIARMLHCSTANVRSQAHRALAKLRAEHRAVATDVPRNATGGDGQ